jgi:hypothetical protein
VAASILYVGKGLTSCFSPMVTGVLACFSFTATTAIKFNQLTAQDDRISELERQEHKSQERIRILEEKVDRVGNEYNDVNFAVAQTLAALDQIALTMGEEDIDTRNQLRKRFLEILVPQQSRDEILVAQVSEVLDQIALTRGGEDTDKRNQLRNRLLKILAPQQSREEVLVPLPQVLEALDQLVLNIDKDTDQRNRLHKQLLNILTPPQQDRDGVLIRLTQGTNLDVELKQADHNRYRWFAVQPVSPVSSDSELNNQLEMSLEDLSKSPKGRDDMKGLPESPNNNNHMNLQFEESTRPLLLRAAHTHSHTS